MKDCFPDGVQKNSKSVLYFQGIRTILVRTVRAFKEQEINSKSKVYQRYETADAPPGGTVQVMQPADYKHEAGDGRSNGNDCSQHGEGFDLQSTCNESDYN